MLYTLTFCSRLNIFALVDPMQGHRTLTKPELLDSIGDNTILRQWVDYTESHPDTRVDYDMLPA